jgi:hypothetical protein
MWKELVVVYFNVLCHNFPRRTGGIQQINFVIVAGFRTGIRTRDIPNANRHYTVVFGLDRIEEDVGGSGRGPVF